MAIKHLQELMNLNMVSSYCYSCIDLLVAVLDFHIRGCLHYLHLVCMREYVISIISILTEGAEYLLKLY